MRSRLVVIVVLSALVAGACGGGKKDVASSSTPGASAEATAAPAASAEASAAPAASAKAGTTAAPAKTAAPAASAAAPVQAAAAGQANKPKPGKYTYVSNGTAQGPTDTSPREVKDREMVVEYTEPRPAAGGAVEIDQRSGGDQGSQTTTLLWSDKQVLLVKTKVVSPAGTFECSYNTPAGGLVILKFPVKAEKLPQQTWSNDQCSGTNDLEILGTEDVTAAGKKWKAYKVKSHTSIKSTVGGTSYDATLDGITWFSPDLGVDVRSERKTEAKYNVTSSVKSDTVTELKAYP